MRTGKYAVRARHDLFQRGVIGHDGNDYIAVRGCFFGSLGNGSPCDGLRFLPGAIIHRKMIPGAYQPRSHVAPHMAHADQANGWLRLFLHSHDIALLTYIPSGAGPPIGTASRMMRSISRSVAWVRWISPAG